jgi:hypothetical protein
MQEFDFPPVVAQWKAWMLTDVVHALAEVVLEGLDAGRVVGARLEGASDRATVEQHGTRIGCFHSWK